MNYILTTITYSIKQDDDIDKLIKTLEYIKNQHISREIKVLNKPIITFKIQEDE